MTITFEVLEFEEADDRWQALFVRIGDGPWKLSKAHWGTENIDEVLMKIRSSNPDQDFTIVIL